MKFFYKIILGFLVILLTTFGKCSGDKNFEHLQNLLERANLIFFEPKDYQIVPIIKNKQVYYDLAFTINKDLEIRYQIYPYDTLLTDYNAYVERKAKGIKPVDPVKGEYEEWKADPNESYKSYFMACLFNICEKIVPLQVWIYY